jgi:GNAT superfamily N-acetyltransferase
VRWTSVADDATVCVAMERVEASGPPFLLEVTRDHRRRLTQVDPRASWLVSAEAGPVAAVRAARLAWDGTPDDAPAAGAAEAVGRAGEDGADCLAVLDVTVAAPARGGGTGRRVLEELSLRAADLGFAHVLLLARPHHKREYPLVPFARYVAATDGAGDPFDPWLRTAWRCGFVPARAVDRSLVARAEIDAWRRWLGRPVPGSGPYLVPGALKPAIVEVERNEGRYREPHLWMACSEGAASDAGWVASLAAIGVVAGDRSHRVVRRER